jgi:hypothetical protein
MVRPEFSGRRFGWVLCRHGRGFGLLQVSPLGFGRRDIADRREGGVFDGDKVSPSADTSDDLGLEQADDRLGQVIIVAVAAAADRRLEAGMPQKLGVLDRQLLHAAVGVMDQSALD